MDRIQAKELVKNKLENRKGKFSSLERLFKNEKEKFAELVNLAPTVPIRIIIFNLLNDKLGFGACKICSKPTKLYEDRGGWAAYCSLKCANDKSSDRTKETKLTKIKNDSTLKNPEIRSKFEKTMLDRHGVINPSASSTIKLMKQNRALEKHGIAHPITTRAVRDKIETSLTTKYSGVGTGSVQIKEKIRSSRLKNMFDKLKSNNPDWVINHDNWISCSLSSIIAQHACGYSDKFKLASGTKDLKLRCPRCHGSSSHQKKVVDFLRDRGLDVAINDRKIIAPKELDIVVHSKRLAIEINGVYFHTENTGGKDKNYHLNKTVLAEANGYTLLHFTDTEIDDDWSSVTNKILYYLDHEPLNLHSIEIKSISFEESQLNDNHYRLDKCQPADLCFGLFSSKVLIGTIVLKKVRKSVENQYEIVSFYAVSSHKEVETMLFSHVLCTVSNKLKIVIDRRWPKDFSTLNFRLMTATAPTFQHVVINKLYNDKLWNCGTLQWVSEEFSS